MTIEPYYDVTEEKNVEFTGMNNDMYFMIPQTLPSDATIAITFVTRNTAETKTFNIGDTEWKAGHTVTYSISTEKEGEEYYISVDEPKEIAGTGGTYTWKVTSYRQTAFGTQSPISWETYFTLNDDTVKHYDVDKLVTSFTKQPTTTKLTNTFSATFGKNYAQSTKDNQHTALLVDAPEKGTKEKPYNLANASGGETVENTANCYVVNAPGHYSIPVVYGNTIKNGAANTDVFGEDKTLYVNHLGNAITSPFLVDNTSVIPDNVSLVWQDALDLIDMDSLKLSDDKKTISFSISKDNICQGNAIIAVRDAKDVIMWSWHIWVTDFSLSTTAMVNHSDVTYDFMDLPLGFCDPDERKSPVQKVVFHFKQIDGETEATLPLNIGQLEESIPFNATYYQYGRKDPMFGYNLGKVLFDVTYPFERQAARPTIAEAITHPSTFYSNSSKAPWASELSQELWDVGHTGTAHYDENPEIANGHSVVKTIYDPSPVGFKAPPPAAFNNFKNSRQSFSKKGTWFYSLPGKKGSIVFWHALGNINVNGNVSDYNSVGRYWTTGNYTENCSHSWRLWFGSNSANADYVESYVGGHIRPIKE